MSFEPIHGPDDVVLDALSHHLDLANMTVVSLKLLNKIRAAYSAALGDL